MNLQEHIRRILMEEDFIPLESLNTVIKDNEDGFDVFIMDKDKKIGEISFAKDDLPNVYTIVDATIDDEYKGNRIYPKTIINLFKERPNIIINSLFRSPEAHKAWIYILNNLPPNIGKSVKYYKEEDTTLIQLKLRNLQEHIRRVLREEIDFTSITQLKRRGYLIDKAFKNNLKHLSSDKFSSREKYFNTLIEYTLRDLHGDYFVYSELPDEEWEEYRDYIIKYIKSNYDI